MTITPSAARDAIAALQGHEAWAIIRRSTRAGDRDTVGVLGGRRSEVASILDIPLESGPPPEGRQCDRLVAVPFRQVAERGFEAHDDGTPLVVVEVESEREFSVADVIDAIDDVAGGLRRPGRVRDRRRRLRQGGRGDHRGRDRPGRGRQPGDRPALPRHRGRLGPGQGAGRLPPAARAGARRLLDLLLLHRRPLPGRRQPRAARQRARRRRADEPDLGHLPGPPAGRRRPAAGDPAARVPARREGDLRALHGRRRGAQDDVRHLPRGRPGARAVPQADDPPHPHRVPPRRPHRPRRPRGAPRHDVRRHGHRQPGGERLPADQALRGRGPRLLRRRAGAVRPRPGRRAGDRQPDRDPDGRRRPRGPAQGHRGRDAGARLRPGVRGGGDAREGGRHPVGVRAGAAGAGARRRPRRGGAPTRTC